MIQAPLSVLTVLLAVLASLFLLQRHPESQQDELWLLPVQPLHSLVFELPAPALTGQPHNVGARDD